MHMQSKPQYAHSTDHDWAISIGAVPGPEPTCSSGAFADIEPEFARPARSAPLRGSAEWKLVKKLDRLIADAADRMEIPRADGAQGIAQKLSDQLYDRHKAKLRQHIPHEPAHATDPGNVLAGAIKEFAIVVFGLGYSGGKLDIARLQTLLAQLEAYCAEYPPNGDARRCPVHALRTLVARLLSYYR
jgi:hypothetical protein